VWKSCWFAGSTTAKTGLVVCVNLSLYDLLYTRLPQFAKVRHLWRPSLLVEFLLYTFVYTILSKAIQDYPPEIQCGTAVLARGESDGFATIG